MLVQVVKVSTRRTRRGRTLVEVQVSDETGSLTVIFFNQPWRKDQLSEGREAVMFGKVDQYRGRLQMTNPLVDLVGDRTGRIVAVYPQSEVARLHSWDVDRLVAEALRRVMKVRGFADPVPVQLITYGILKEAKNPNTAKLLIHWLTTPEGARVYEDAVYRGNPYVEGTEMERLIGSRNIAYHEGERLAEFKSMTEKMIELLEKNR